MLVLGAVMFGAIIAGVALSREEDDSDEEEEQ
jgi:Kef-type K+ transport system membrane component KefB